MPLMVKKISATVILGGLILASLQSSSSIGNLLAIVFGYQFLAVWLRSPKKKARNHYNHHVPTRTDEEPNPRMKRWLEEVEEGKRANRANQISNSRLWSGTRWSYQKTAAQTAGEKGEENVAYVLKYLDTEKFTVFNDIHLRGSTESQQFDHLVIGPTGVFHIETKNWSGTFRITKDGEWLKVVNGAEVGEISPIFQVNRHQKILESVVGPDIPVTGIIAFVNYNSVVREKENSPIKVLKAEMLQQYIENEQPARLNDFQIRRAVSVIKARIIHK